MPLLPRKNVQQRLDWKGPRPRALWQGVSRPKWRRGTRVHPCLPQMWHGGPICEGCWQNTKQTQNAERENLWNNHMGTEVM